MQQNMLTKHYKTDKTNTHQLQGIFYPTKNKNIKCFLLS